MKKYLVTFNHPVIIDGGKPELYTIYGLLVPYEEITKEEINTYISYLAAMHEWSVKREKSFSVNEEYDWVDHNGVVHPCCDEWALKLQKKCRKRLALDFSLSVIHVDETGEDCDTCGREGSFIICKHLMEKLIKRAKIQEESPEEQCGLVLFNHPIWLPKSIIWKGETGYCHLYGLTIDREKYEKELADSNLYLGYLAMVEEFIQNGKTPSGYTTDIADDGYLWYLQDKTFFCTSDEIKAEGLLCRRIHNLELYPVVGGFQKKDLEYGVRDDFIVSQKLYEDMLELI